jgi:sarcosine oxidase delta subunit
MKHGKDCIICAFCGAVKKEVSFIIGASSKPDWCMIYGTGKMACPACYEKGQAEAQVLADAHVAKYNQKGTK